MNLELKNKKVAFLLFCTVTDWTFSGCQTIEQTTSQTDSYDYGARYYEMSLNRFSVIDPVAEKYPSISPYAYRVTGPIYIDLEGDSSGKAILTSVQCSLSQTKYKKCDE